MLKHKEEKKIRATIHDVKSSNEKTTVALIFKNVNLSVDFEKKVSNEKETIQLLDSFFVEQLGVVVDYFYHNDDWQYWFGFNDSI